MEKFDLSRPFLAIREDEEGSDYEPTMGEYLCNPLDEDLLDAEVSLGGFYSIEELGVIESNESKRRLFVVPAGKAVPFALSTWDEYCEMVCHWSIRYRTATSGNVVLGFGSSKRLADCVVFEDVPILGGRARVVPRS